MKSTLQKHTAIEIRGYVPKYGLPREIVFYFISCGQGEGENEKGIVKRVNSDKLDSILADSIQRSETERWKLNADKLNANKLLNAVVVAVNPRYYRPPVHHLVRRD